MTLLTISFGENKGTNAVKLCIVTLDNRPLHISLGKGMLCRIEVFFCSTQFFSDQFFVYGNTHDLPPFQALFKLIFHLNSSINSFPLRIRV